MKKWLGSSLVVATLAMLIVVACVPQATPVAAPTPAAPPLLVPVAPVISAEETAWQKVVEAAKREGKVNVYSSTMLGDVGMAVSKAFKDKYGITVDIITGRGPDFIERVKTERRVNQQVADSVDFATTDVSNMAEQNLLVRAGDYLPVLREKGVWSVGPTIVDPERKAVLMNRLFDQANFINTRLVRPGEAPDSWNDLLDPKWKGKMSLKDPRVNPGVIAFFVAMLDRKAWDGEDYIKALFRQDLRMVKSPPDALRLLASGANPLALMVPDGAASTFVLQGAPIQAIDMREGTIMTGGGLAAVSGGPHPNATLVYLNWMLEPEGQIAYGKTRGARIIRNDVADFRPPAVVVKIRNPIFITEEYGRLGNERVREKWLHKLVGW